MRLFALRFLQVARFKSQTMVGLGILALGIINHLKENEMASINTNRLHHAKNQLWLSQDIKAALITADIKSIVFRRRAKTEFTLPKRSAHTRLIKDALRHIVLYGCKTSEETILCHRGESISIIPDNDAGLIYISI